MARKRKRKVRLNIAPILWALFVVNVLAGLFFSRSTRLRVVRVSGASEGQKTEITRLVNAFRSQPSMQITANMVGTKVLRLQAIGGFSWDRNVFGRAILKVTQKHPVTVVSAENRLVLDDEGTLLQVEEIPQNLMTTIAPLGAYRPALTIVGNWESVAVANLCEQVSRKLPKLGWKLVQEPSGKVSLYTETGGKVSFGSLNKIDEKMSVISKALDEQPELLDKVQELNVIAPSSPVIVPK